MIKLFSATLFLATSITAQMFPFPGPNVPVSGGGGTPITLINACGKDNGGFTLATFLLNSCAGSGGSLNHTAGNFLVVGVMFQSSTCSAATTITVANTAGDLWVNDDTYTASTLGCIATFHVASTNGNASDVLTLTTGVAGFLLGGIVMQFSGVAPTSQLDVFGAGNFTAAVTSFPTATFTTASAHEVAVLFANCAGGRTFTAGLIGGATMTTTAAMVTTSSVYAAEYLELNSIQTGVTAAITTNTATSCGVALVTYRGL